MSLKLNNRVGKRLMKKITVQNIKSFADEDDLTFISRSMDLQLSHEINAQSWKEYYTVNRASFSIAYSENSLFLKFYVKEQYLNSSVRNINGDVHKDNCVEFFIAFEKEYYNIEVNCLGSIKVGYGEGRQNRKMLSEDTIKKIKIHTILNSSINSVNDLMYWEILLIIPKELFCFSSIDSFQDLNCKANFYKCGDDLPEPHYLSWNLIETENPDFHRPEFFGELYFE